jgi:uncharacterized protein (TIGR02246 family)
MKKFVIPIIILVVLSVGSESKPENINQTKEIKIMEKQDKQQIERLLSEYKNSLNTSDAALAQSLYAKDGVFMPAGAPSAIGTESIRKSYEFIFSQIQLNIEFYIDEIIVDGNFAFASTSSKGTTLIHANGQTVPEENRELFLFEKIDSVWKIARYMFNKTK